MPAKHWQEILEEASPLFYERLVEAAKTQGMDEWDEMRGFLHDPIEDQPEFAEKIRLAGQMAEVKLKPTLANLQSRRGYAGLYSFTQKRILLEVYGIEWFTPNEMNPHVMFD